MRASRALNASASDDPADVRSIRLNSIDLGSLRSFAIRLRALNMPVLHLRAVARMSSGRDHDLEKPDAQPGGSAFHRASPGGREIDVRPGKSPQRLVHSNVRPHHGEIQNLMSLRTTSRLRPIKWAEV